MSKGQISIDLIITLIVAIMVAGSMAAVLDGYRTGQDKMLLENQVKTEAVRLSDFITASQAISDTNFYAFQPINRISYKGNLFYPEVEISKDLNTIKVRAVTKEMTIDADSNFSRQSGMDLNIDLVQSLLVVKNAH